MSDYISQIINLVSALGGVILGWLLAELSKKGKLEILDNHSDITMLGRNESGGFIEVDKAFDSDMIEFRIHLEFYNFSSSNKKVIRELKLQVVPKDNEKGSDSITLEDSAVDSFNVNPQELKELKMAQSISKDLCEQLNDSEVYLTYKDVRGKPNRFLLNEPNTAFLKNG